MDFLLDLYQHGGVLRLDEQIDLQAAFVPAFGLERVGCCGENVLAFEMQELPKMDCLILARNQKVI